MMHTTQMLSAARGDITLGWTDDQVEMMTKVIANKMKEGFSFFIVADDGREVRLRKIDDLQGRNAVTIGDKDAELLIRQGKIGIVDVSAMVKDSDAPVVTTRRAKTAREAAAAQTVAVPPARGG